MLTHLSPALLMKTASNTSLSVLFFALLRKVVFSRNCSHPQRLQWSTRCPPKLLLTANQCSLACSLKQRPVQPIYTLSNFKGIL